MENGAGMTFTRVRRPKPSLFSFLFVVSLFNPIGSWALPTPRLKFQYVSFDGGLYLDCRHSLVDPELRDWDVSCGNNQKNFRVHFHVKEYVRPVTPAKSIEVVYYIVRSTPGTSTSSQAVWIDLEKDSPLSGVTFHQSVDNDTASLILRFSPAGDL
jgi:hypothetical protein